VTAVASLTRVRVVVDHTTPVFNFVNLRSGVGDAHSTAKVNKVNDLALTFWSVSLRHQDFIICSRNILSKRFST